MAEAINTNTLMRQLFKTDNLDRFLQDHEEQLKAPDFCSLLKTLCEEKKLSTAQVIEHAQIERTYGYQLLSGTRRPSRDKVLQLAFGAGLSVADAQKLLRAAGKSPLYPKLKRDAVILYGLHKRFSILAVQEMLADCGLTMLGELRNE